MRRSLSQILLVPCAAVAAHTIAPVTVAQLQQKRPPLANEQWVQLFNGKDLTNWWRSARSSSRSIASRTTPRAGSAATVVAGSRGRA